MSVTRLEQITETSGARGNRRETPCSASTSMPGTAATPPTAGATASAMFSSPLVQCRTHRNPGYACRTGRSSRLSRWGLGSRVSIALDLHLSVSFSRGRGLSGVSG